MACLLEQEAAVHRGRAGRLLGVAAGRRRGLTVALELKAAAGPVTGDHPKGS